MGTDEGFAPYFGHQTWYRSVGTDHSPLAPLLCLHGGPGVPHDYLEPLEKLASSGRRVIFYDQLGCGRSAVSTPHDPSMWSVELFLSEIDALRKHLGLANLHLFGHSWGGMLALEYAAGRAPGLCSIVVASSPASFPEWRAELNRLLKALPTEVQETIRTHEAAGTTSSLAYQQAALTFYRRHLCRLDPFPACLQRAMHGLEQNPEVYAVMNGPSEFTVTGLLKDWDIRERLRQIEVPALLYCGRHDEVTPATVKAVKQRIPGSQWHLFENSAHMCHLEETEQCLTVIQDFLEAVERS